MKNVLLFLMLVTTSLSYAQSDVTFNVDMNCATDPFTTVYVVGPAIGTGWCDVCNPLEDPDMDGVWTGTYSFPDGDLEYKYQVDGWAFQEDLVDDMNGGGTCAPITDFVNYANRIVTVNGATATDDTYGQCGPCSTGASDVTFNVDMNCATDPFTTVYVVGPAIGTGWCPDCNPLSDPDMDGVWTGTYSFPDGDLEYKYQVDEWAFQEDLVDDMNNGASCAPITDFVNYANRIVTVDGATSTDDAYGQCDPCSSGLANDDLCSSQEIVVNDPPIGADNTDATVDGGQASCWTDNGVEGDIWFHFTAPASGGVVVQTFDIGDNNDTQVAVYSSSDETCTGTLTEVGCNDDISMTDYMSLAEVTGLTPGATYFVHVDGWDGTIGEFDISIVTLIAPCSNPGAVICDNMDDYTLGPIDVQAAHWGPWSVGGTTSNVSDEQAFSNAQSLKVGPGGVEDNLLLLNDETTGVWQVDWMMYVPASATGFINIQADPVAGNAFIYQCFFNAAGAAPGVGSFQQLPQTFNYPEDAWFPVSIWVDLNNAVHSLTVDGVDVLSGEPYVFNAGPGPTGDHTLSAINFYSIDALNTFYVDDVIYDGDPDVSVGEVESLAFNLYPNPTNDIITISSEKRMDQLIIHNVMGAVVMNINENLGEVAELDLSSLDAGIYTLTVKSQNIYSTKKVVKR